jgi:hypothetical protein
MFPSLIFFRAVVALCLDFERSFVLFPSIANPSILLLHFALNRVLITCLPIHCIPSRNVEPPQQPAKHFGEEAL